MADREIWFEYVRLPGKISAVPVHWKGWVLLLAISAAPAVGGLAMKRWVPGFGPEHVFLYLIASFVVVFGLLAILLKTRGRPRR
jgi:hypothetical protein